jgi:hypothetical protein
MRRFARGKSALTLTLSPRERGQHAIEYWMLKTMGLGGPLEAKACGKNSNLP